MTLRPHPLALAAAAISMTPALAQDSVTIRQKFRWRSIDDDWKTRHLKLAPISPVLALGLACRNRGISSAILELRWYFTDCVTENTPSSKRIRSQELIL